MVIILPLFGSAVSQTYINSHDNLSILSFIYSPKPHWKQSNKGFSFSFIFYPLCHFACSNHTTNISQVNLQFSSSLCNLLFLNIIELSFISSFPHTKKSWGILLINIKLVSPFRKVHPAVFLLKPWIARSLKRWDCQSEPQFHIPEIFKVRSLKQKSHGWGVSLIHRLALGWGIWTEVKWMSHKGDRQEVHTATQKWARQSLLVARNILNVETWTDKGDSRLVVTLLDMLTPKELLQTDPPLHISHRWSVSVLQRRFRKEQIFACHFIRAYCLQDGGGGGEGMEGG